MKARVLSIEMLAHNRDSYAKLPMLGIKNGGFVHKHSFFF